VSHSQGGEAAREVLVRAMALEAEGVMSLILAARDGAPLPEWAPGAHIDLVTPQGAVAQYSLCGRLDDCTWRVAVLLQREGRGVSRYVHDGLRPGAVVTVRGPRNHFHMELAARYLFIAGGIGITPILPMVEAAEREGAQWRLVYCGRSEETMAFTGELDRYGPRVALFPKAITGRAPLARIVAGADAGTAIYTCGPERLIDEVCDFAQRHSLAAPHVERFAPAAPLSPPAPGGDSFAVKLARSGIECAVPPDRTIVEVLLERGVYVPTSCLQGVCGSCETRVLAGAIDHRDAIISEADRQRGDSMMICVSRAAGLTLTLDL
jgi:ferredoxin-NADP reductase